jgi:DNA-binding Xre family transcriptional regulator
MYTQVNLYFKNNSKRGKSVMISYQPLFELLKERNMKISEFRELGVHPKTIAAMNRGDYVTLATIEKFCEVLRVPVEKVIKIEFVESK